ncbi:MAG: NAD-dependent dehydratase [Thiotrichales bacterium]|nr:NAD-dependent dehydratase [Thiotrichales bacterium]
MTTLVTGATGFVGSAVVRRLLDAGHDVRVLARPASRRDNLEGLSVDIVEGDLRDAESLVAAVKGCDTLFHVAADYRLWVRRPDDLYEANVSGSLNLFRAAADAGVERMVYTSSVATLGLNADGTSSTETTPVDGDEIIGHYKRSKYLAEQQVRTMAKREHLPVVTVNPSTPIGPRDLKPTPTGRVIVQAARGRIPAFVDTGLNVVHVDDVADGHLLALERGEVGERYILGGENWTLQQVLTEIAKLTGRRAPSIKLSQSMMMPLVYLSEAFAWALHGKRAPMLTVDGLRMSQHKMFFSSDKAISNLGYSPRNAEEAVHDAVVWFREHRYC